LETCKEYIKSEILFIQIPTSYFLLSGYITSMMIRLVERDCDYKCAASRNA